jgi:hypothetical protein
MLLLTSYGLGGTELDAVRDRWTGWWERRGSNAGAAPAEPSDH